MKHYRMVSLILTIFLLLALLLVGIYAIPEPLPLVTSAVAIPTATSPNNSVERPISDSLPAFPGAEGWGAVSIGGRGGRIIEVTNLNNSGPGSLRDAITAAGPRIIVFRVSGTIELTSRIEIYNPYITIAGQTAPGNGITIKNSTNVQAPIEIATQHVIMRYLRLRPGPPDRPSSTVDGITIAGDSKYVILDHISLSWANDENVNTWDAASEITIQWSIVAEGLLNANHLDSHPHSNGMLLGSQSTRISIHHNLLAHNDQRNPRVTGGDVDFVNNVIYNAGSTPSGFFDLAGISQARCNYVGNFIKEGPNSHFDSEVVIESTTTLGVSCFVAGNIGPHRAGETLPEFDIVDPKARSLLATTRFDFPPVATMPARYAYDQVLAQAGAILPVRDSVDARIVADVRNGTGKLIDDPSEVGGWPVMATGTPAVDGDKDGMADIWETLHGLNPNDASDRNTLAPSGYTYVEEYLNQIGR